MYTYSEQHGETNILPQEQKREKGENKMFYLFSNFTIYCWEYVANF